jgi:hypothetical protein
LATTTAFVGITPAMAQSTATSDNGGLEEIIVTAQKRAGCADRGDCGFRGHTAGKPDHHSR